MPYITKDRREVISINEDCWGGVHHGDLQNAGELNYWLTTVCRRYLGKEYNYQKLNDVIGALEGCKLELYARVIRPYEDKKIEENGDVY